MYLISEDYLAHHGIKGQKWGVRRYRNTDGTLTEEGKKRYSSNSGAFKKAVHETHKSYVVKHPRSLPRHERFFSDSEIDEIVARIDKKRRLKDIAAREEQRGIDEYRRLGDAFKISAAIAISTASIAKLAGGSK